jgi:urease accessory protein
VNLRLLQLASPALPVGAYSYSQGLEAAVEAGTVHDAASARAWIGDVMTLGLGRLEAPVLLRLVAAWERGDTAAVRRWNDELVASRETAELRAETLQMGHSLRILLRDLGVAGLVALGIEEICYPTSYAYACVAWKIAAREALQAYLFSWLENQVLAAVKCIPLGQTDGQRMLLELAAGIPSVTQAAEAASDEDLGAFLPGLARASSSHETQYSRIFRS